jgi:ABC-type multidrug transport system ATPase subunit
LRLKNEFGKTVVLSSHILSEVELIADSMVIMNKGKAVAQGSVQQLLSTENLLVKVEVENVESVRHLLNATPFQVLIEKMESTSITFKLSREQIPGLNAILVQQNVPVFGLSYQRPLEEYFLKITQGGGTHV